MILELPGEQTVTKMHKQGGQNDSNELLGLKFENEFWDERLAFLCKRNKLSKGVSEVRYFLNHLTLM